MLTKIRKNTTFCKPTKNVYLRILNYPKIYDFRLYNKGYVLEKRKYFQIYIKVNILI